MDLSVVNIIVLKFGECFLLLVHSLYSFTNYLLGYMLYILHHLKQCYGRTYRPISSSVSVNVFKHELSLYPKLPKHLVVIIEEKDISYNDCVKLILWSIHSGISFITFYSFSNAINPPSLYEVLYKRSKNSLQSIKWGKSFHNSVKEMAKRDINGYAWTPVTEVNMFSSKTVKDTIENVMLRLCQERIDPLHITIDTVDNKFKDEITLPDPCLAIVFGKAFSTFGFMPWQIRVTEFVHVQTHHNIQVEDFLSALRSYAYCHQRFGK